MALTYEPIATTTLGSAGTITFSSIPTTYTDLRVVLTGKGLSGTPNDNVRIVLNSDTSATYSYTELYGGGTPTCVSYATQFNMYLNSNNANLSDTVPTFYTIDFFQYKNTSINKAFLATANMDLNGSGSVAYTSGLWRSNSAISTILLTNGAASYSAGTTATLYGIKAA